MAEYITKNQIGNVVDVVVHSMFSPGDSERAVKEKRKHTSLAQQARNDKNAAGRMAFIALGNFADDDLYLTLSYDDAHLPGIMSDVKDNAASIRRKIDYRWGKLGQPLKYIKVIEGLESGKRYHHHWMLNRPPGMDIDAVRDMLSGCWPCGSIHLEYINGNKGRTAYDLSLYFYKEIKVFGRPAGTHGFTCSQNLCRGAPITDIMPDNMPVEIPPGIPLDHILIQETQQLIYSRYVHLRYILPYISDSEPNFRPAEIGAGTSNNFITKHKKGVPNA